MADKDVLIAALQQIADVGEGATTLNVTACYEGMKAIARAALDAPPPPAARAGAPREPAQSAEVQDWLERKRDEANTWGDHKTQRIIEILTNALATPPPAGQQGEAMYAVSGETMGAIALLCDVHTRDDSEVGYTVHMLVTLDPWHDRSRYTRAWGTLRATLRASAQPTPPAEVTDDNDGVKTLQWPGVMLIVAGDGSATYSIKANNPNNQFATGGVDFDLPEPLSAAIRRSDEASHG